MMTTDIPIRPDVAFAPFPVAMVWVLAVVGVIGWSVTHRFAERLKGVIPSTRGALFSVFLIKVVVASLAVWLLTQALSRRLVLETGWSLWSLSIIGGLAVEMAILLYQWEKRLVSPRRGRLLLALRLGAITAVWLILAQPVIAWMQQRKIARHVVVLVDDSESMQLVDKNMSATEKLDAATALQVPAAQGRWQIKSAEQSVNSLRQAMANEAESWKTLGQNEASKNGNEAKDLTQGLSAKAEAWKTELEAVVKKLEPLRGQENTLDETSQGTLRDLWPRLTAEIPQALKEVISQASPQLAEGLQRVAATLSDAEKSLHALAQQADATYLTKALKTQDQEAITSATAVPRATIARDFLTKAPAGKPSLLESLRSSYDVKLVRFGKGSAEASDLASSSPASDLRSRTDLSGALQETLNSIPSESLAGVLLLSDGRHNGATPVNDSGRALGLQGSPVRAVAIGSLKGPKDAAFLSLQAPESIFLGDKLRVSADLKAEGMKGGQLKVSLLKGTDTLASEIVAVPEDDFRTSVRLVYAPKDKGIGSYSLKIDPVEGELFDKNNVWPFEAAVTDDRTNVLLVDSWPRWEFRYLRNLFYGRDKSVHLQSVILNPDEIRGQDLVPVVNASASRKFGDAEATRLPANEAEWMKFDVIMIGDVPPAQLGQETWKIIEKCVSERGALLVAIAGPRSMPHAHSNDTAKALLPVEYSANSAPLFSGPEESYRLRLTSEGKESPLLQQSASSIETQAIWANLPTFQWRNAAITGAKTGSEVLAYAESASGSRQAIRSADDQLAAFTQQRTQQAKNSLIVTSRHGLGKVAMINFDQTWRLRYGVGDTYHHRFWGNILRWGAGEKLRAGTETVRLGTDKLTYEPTAPVTLLAKITSDGFKPRTDATISSTIFNEAGQEVLQRSLQLRPDSNGLYETTLSPESLPASGRYRVELTGADVQNALKSGQATKVETHFTRATDTSPIEMGALALDTDTLRQVTSLSGGSLHTLSEAPLLAQSFGPPSKILHQRRETTLWDNWPLLLTFLTLVITEWLVRRKGGLV